MSITTIVLISVAAINLILAIFVYLRNKKSLINIFFSITILGCALWNFGLVFYRNGTLKTIDFWGQFVYFGITFTVVFFLYFSFVFPSGKFIKNNILRLFLFSTSILIFFITLIPNVIIKENIIKNGEVSIVFGWGYFIHSFLLFFYFSWAFINLIVKYKKSVGLIKTQLFYVFLGTLISVSIGIFTNLILFFITTEYNWIGPAGTIIMVGFITYNITRYQLMDIRVVIRNGIVVFTALALLISISVPAVILVAYIVGYPINYFVFWIAVAIFTGCVLLFIPLKKILENFFNKYFFASLYNEEQVLNSLIRKIPEVLNLEELVNLIVDTTKKTLQIEKVSLWFIDTNNKEYEPLKNINFGIDLEKYIINNKTISKYFLRYHKPIVYQELNRLIDNPRFITPRKVFEKIMKIMVDHQVEIILPLILKKKIVGMIFLGQKIDKASYSSRDVDILKIIADQSAVALENASLYKETQQFAEKMKKEVQKATAKLRRINKQLMKLDKAKSEFISIASHQLRTPITAIKGYTSMVLEGDYGKVGKNLLPAIERIFKSSNRMNALVENLLNISRIESGKVVYDFQEVDFNEMTNGIVQEFESTVKNKGLKLNFIHPQKPLMVPIDKVKIREVVSNLIDNAIKYTEKGKIEVKLQLADEYKSKFILLSVKDTGMGVAEEDLPNVFQKFRRGKKIALVHTEGLGLGMYFAQKTVEAHKGKIWVESPGVGKGSTFFVCLPIND